jgi:hypothetical protein
MTPRAIGAGGVIVSLRGTIEISYAWGLGILLITL